MKRLSEIQDALASEQCDGWLLYDFHELNPIARKVAGVPAATILTRRWACFIPSSGSPRWLIHAIELGGLAGVAPGAASYVSWQSWRAGLERLLAGCHRVAMEVSPGAAVPTVSRVDAGTVELVRSLGVEVVSSADLVQVADAVWTPEQLASHRRAAQALSEIKDAAFDRVRRALAAGTRITEVGVQSFVMDEFARCGLETDHPPIVGVNAHAADPHFAPDPTADTAIEPGDLLLLDMWAKEADPEAIFGDITWMAYAGQRVPARIQTIFEVVRQARDCSIAFADERVRCGRSVYGYEVDDAARAVIAAAGFGEAFIHRTGHSIGTSVHGNGVNIDNLETQDRRRLLAGVGFSIEPGIYLPQEGIGVRLEVDCHVGADGVEVTTQPQQQEIVLLM